jgi:histidinol-phosphatase
MAGMSTISQPSLALLHQLRAVALAAADAGARAALPYFRNPALAVEWKSDDSPVTRADREAEAAIKAVIRAAYPDDAWLGEETGEEGGGSGRRWIVDPIDGTRNFVRGVPLWATLVACEADTPTGPRIIASAVLIPALGERYDAMLDGGARCNGTAIAVSKIARLDEALFCYESPGWFMKNHLTGLFGDLCQRTALQRGLCDAYGHMLVATGRAEIVVEPQLSVWDVAATSLIVSEAGGRFSALDGADTIRANNAVVTNGHLHDEVLRAIAEVKSGVRESGCPEVDGSTSTPRSWS